jgi:hypothetical protein
MSMVNAIAIIEAENPSHLLSLKASYLKLGSDHFDYRNVEAQRSHLIRRLEVLGVNITIETLPVAACSPAWYFIRGRKPLWRSHDNS